MKYMLLIYAPEIDQSSIPKEEMDAYMQQWFAFDADMRKSVTVLAGEALQRTPTATSVRAPNGKVTTTDGPFAETKEALGGFYMLDVPSIDEALEWAGKCPGAAYGTIEVRPVLNIEMPA